MTAAAGAARVGSDWVDDGRTAVWALALVVAAGLVEGVALGLAQGGVLPRWVPALQRARFLAATVVVAGLGWAAASAPSVLAGDDGAADPPLWGLLAGAAGLGVVLGAALGAAQAVALPAPARRTWVLASVAAWPAAMVVIFLGATRAGADWGTGEVLLLGAVTGAAAGAVLGAVTGGFLPRLARAAGD